MALAKDEKRMLSRGEGCLAKAEPNEPVFILRAQDGAMLNTVKRWIEITEEANLGPNDKTQDARKFLKEITEWQKANATRVKIAD